MEAPNRCNTDNKPQAKWTESFVDFGPDLLFSDPSLHACSPTLARIDATDLKSTASIQKELKSLVQKYVPYSPGI